MRQIPLYPEVPKLAVEREVPSEVLPVGACTRCDFGARARSSCIKAEGKPGGIYIVTDHPSVDDDNAGRLLQGQTGYFLRRLVKDYCGDVPVVLDLAVKCKPGGYDTEKAVQACRAHLALVMQQAQPQRIFAMGSTAIKAVTGRSVPPFDVRRGYAWTSTGIPVFFMSNPLAGMRNHFVRGWIEADFKWAVTAQPPVWPQWGATTHIVETVQDAEEAVADLRKAEWVAFDCEWVGKPFSAFQMVDMALFARGSDSGWSWDVKALSRVDLKAPLAKLMADAKVPKVGQSMNGDCLAVLSELGVELRNIHADTRLKRKLITMDIDADLELMAELVGMGGHKEEKDEHLELARKTVTKLAKENLSNQQQLIPRELNGIRANVIAAINHEVELDTYSYGFLPPEMRTRYCARDALTTAHLEVVQDVRLKEDEPELGMMWSKIVKPLSDAIRHIEAWGVLIDRTVVKNLSAYVRAQLSEVEARLNQQAKAAGMPKEFRDSYKYVGELLFKKLKLESTHLTKSGKDPSTDDEALEAIKDSHPIIPDIQEYRRLMKLDGTYATGMLRHIRDDGRIHPSLKPDGTRTGRPSCRDPNLQTFPRDSASPEAKMCRDMVVSEPGWILLEADFSQLELRIAAMLSGDEDMMAIFIEGRDFHQEMAEFLAPIIWGIKASEVTKKHRYDAKPIVFGLIYGMTDEGLAERVNTTKNIAAKIRVAVLGRFKRLASWIQERLQYAKKHGCTWTFWDGHKGRRRPLWQIADDDGRARVTAENSSFNTPVQGSGSDYLLASLIQVVALFREDALPAKVVLPIHDSLLMEVRKDVLEEVAYQVHRIMTSHKTLHGMKLEVDLKCGPSFGSMEPYKLAA